MEGFSTPRLLLEIRRNNKWEARKIYCDFPTVKACLNTLPKIAEEYGLDINDMRIKYLQTMKEIADAKQRVYKNTRRKKD